MTGLEIWLLAIGLAMDCFAVSIASGIILKRTRWKPMLIMAFAFGFFQAIMPFIGWMCAKTFSHLIESVDHWIAFAILAFLGGRMILESFKEEECCKLFNPANPKVVLTMAIATSIAFSGGFLRLRLELRHVGDQPRGFLHRPGDGLQESGIQFLGEPLEGQRDDVVHAQNFSLSSTGNLATV